MLKNPILKGFNPDPASAERETIIISPYRHLNGFRESRSIIPKI